MICGSQTPEQQQFSCLKIGWNNMKTIIIDDEKKNIVRLKKILQDHFGYVSVAGEAYNAAEAVALIAETQPELLLLDIIMPGKSAFDMLSGMGSYDFDIIFITGYDAYALQAIKFSALDYLLKPVQVPELGIALQKAQERRQQKQTGQQVRNLLSMLGETRRREHQLALPVNNKEIRFVLTTDILRCEAEDCYTRIHLVSGEQLLITKGMYEYDELLVPYGFLRCHRSHLVNTYHIKSFFREDSGELLLSDNTPVPVSRNHRVAVKDALLRR
jgi:two-component system LytT family response regulator